MVPPDGAFRCRWLGNSSTHGSLAVGGHTGTGWRVLLLPMCGVCTMQVALSIGRKGSTKNLHRAAGGELLKEQART